MMDIIIVILLSILGVWVLTLSFNCYLLDRQYENMRDYILFLEEKIKRG